VTESDRDSLQARLDELKSTTADRFGADVAAKTARAYDDQVSSVRDARLVERALGVGDRVPDFAAWTTAGRVFRLRRTLTRGPAVVAFYRGGW
jgi:hypothetical protein